MKEDCLLKGVPGLHLVQVGFGCESQIIKAASIVLKSHSPW